MADPVLVLLILIATSPADGPRGRIVSGAIIDALGHDARVLVEERTSALSDAEAVRVLGGSRGNAVAEVEWTDPAHSHARLHVYLANDRTWYDRELSFEVGDATDERERAMGLLVGAMIRANEVEVEARRIDPSKGQQPPPQPAPAPNEPSTTSTSTPPSSDTPAPHVPERPFSRLGVDVSALVVEGIDGDASSLGPSARGYVSLARWLSIGAGGSIGFGSIDAADARSTTTRITAGARWVLTRFFGEVISLDLGTSMLVVNHAIHRDDPITTRDRWLWGGHVDVGLGVRPTPSSFLEPFVNVGLDALAGDTPITVAGRTMTHMPPFRAALELGLRMHFF